ncbi:MAG TPA: ankyrin repeat domain-containing protein [Vicinamibacterales bacterium]
MSRTSRFAVLIACGAAWTWLSAAQAAGDRRLADAAERRDRAAVEALLNQRVDVNAPQADGATALHWAAHWDDLTTVDRLIRAGANVNAANENGVTPLSLACENANAPVTARLLEAGANANAALATGETPLMTAARTGSAEAVAALLAHGADVQVREKTRGQTALMWAAAQAHAAIVTALIARGADVRARSTTGFTPLLFAARAGDAGSARLLVEAGAPIDDPAADGSTPLLVATASNQEAVALWLLDHGANPNLANEIGYTPLHAIVWKPSAKEGVIPPNGSVALVKALLAHGAKIGARLEKDPPALPGSYRFETGLAGATAFWLAARAANPEVMRALAANGSDIEQGNKDGTTPLMVAAGVGQPQGPGSVPERQLLEGVEAALALGAQVNATNGNGQTAMHGAAGLGFNSIVKVLAGHGANPALKDKRGQTPLDAAMRRKDALQSTIELLNSLMGR